MSCNGCRSKEMPQPQGQAALTSQSNSNPGPGNKSEQQPPPPPQGLGLQRHSANGPSRAVGGWVPLPTSLTELLPSPRWELRPAPNQASLQL